MRIPLLFAVVAVFGLSQLLWAQDPHDLSRYKKSPLSTTLRGIAAHDLSYPPAQMAALISEGLNGSADEKVAALYAIGGRSGILMNQTPENLAAWATNRSALLAFRNRVQHVMVNDQDEFVREAAVLAFAGLSMRPENGEWATELDVKDVAFLARAFHGETFGGARTDIVKLVVGCKCDGDALDARKQLVRDSLSDGALAVVQQGIMGAADLRVVDALDYVARLLKHEDRATRALAAGALTRFGRDAGRYLGELQAAAAAEQDPEIRSILRGSLKAVAEAER